MVSFTLFTLTLLHGVAFGGPAPAPAKLFERQASLKCNRDNCYNVMTNTPSVASPFCSTFLKPTTIVTITPTATIIGTSTITPTLPPPTTASVFIPSHISSQCVLTTSPPLTSRLSSACSCLSVTPISGTATLTTYAPTVTIANPCGTLPNPYTVGGDTFNIYCNFYQYGNLLLELFDVPDMPSCIAICTNTEGCIGVSFIEQSSVGYRICSIMETLADYGNTDNGNTPPGYGFAILTNQTLPSDLFTPCGGAKRCIG